MTGQLQQFDEQSLEEIGRELHRFATDLYPICRRISGDEIRRTLEMIGERIPLQISEVPTGVREIARPYLAIAAMVSGSAIADKGPLHGGDNEDHSNSVYV